MQILSGAIAERVTLTGYVALSVFVSGVVFSLAVRSTWGGGFLAHQSIPYHDFAGSGVVHIVGGGAAFAGAFIVGPRHGRWDPAKHNDFVPHDVKSVLGGVLIVRACLDLAAWAPCARGPRSNLGCAALGRMVWLA
jgi:Amt family ammonium transporter